MIDHLGRTPSGKGDTIVAAIGLTLALLLFPLRFFVSQALVHTIPIVMGTASGLYLLVDRFEGEEASLHHWRMGAGTGYGLQIATALGIAGMVVVGWATGGRTLPFFGVAAFVGTLIFAQIFFLREDVVNPTAILAQVVAFALVTRGVALVMTPSTIGVDSWVHLPEYAQSIRETGQLSAIADSKYVTAPLYHLYVVVAAEAFGTSLPTALYLTLGIVLPLSVLLIYYATGYFLSVRWALFAAAGFSVADHFVRWGIHIIPTSMGLLFFLGVFYGVARIYSTERAAGTYALVLLFSVATVFTHQISSFILLVFLGAGMASQLYGRLTAGNHSAVDYDDGHVNFAGLFAVVAPITAVNWHFTPTGGGSFLAGMVARVQTRVGSAGFLDLASGSTVENDAIASMTTSIPMSVQILNSLGFLLLLFVTLVGSFTLLRYRNRQSLSLTWIGATALMLFVTLGMPMLGLYFLIPGRWYAFMYVPMIVVGAYGMYHLETNMTTRQLVAVMVIFALVFPGAMLVNNKATHDNPVADEYYQQYAYSESELAAANTISDVHSDSEVIQADHPYYIFLRDAKDMPAFALEVNADGAVTGDRVLYRTEQTKGATQVEYEGETYALQLSPDDVCKPTMNVVFSNREVRYCQSTP